MGLATDAKSGISHGEYCIRAMKELISPALFEDLLSRIAEIFSALGLIPSLVNS